MSNPFKTTVKPEKKKAYTTTTERKAFGEFVWLQRKTFQTGGRYKKPYINQESHIYHRNISSVAPIFLGKGKFCTGAGRCMLPFSQEQKRDRGRNSQPRPRPRLNSQPQGATKGWTTVLGQASPLGSEPPTVKFTDPSFPIC